MGRYDRDKRTGLWLADRGGLTIAKQRDMLLEHREYLSRTELGRLLPPMSGGSFQTGTVTELVYANVASGTAKTTFSTEATPILNDTTGMGPQAQFLPAFWDPAYARAAKAIHIVARGIFSVTATPTYQFLIRLGATGTGGSLVWQAPTFTATTGVTNKGWQIEADIIMRTMGAPGANSTVQGIGIQWVDATGTTTTQPLFGWGNNTQPGTVATFDWSITNLVNINVICSASSASNSVTLLQLLVFGLN